MHVAFLVLPAPGHVYPNLGVAAELVRRGHRVTYATTERLAPGVTEIGGRPLLIDLGLKDLPRPTPKGGPRHLAPSHDWLWQAALTIADRMLPVLDKAFADDRPDLIIHDGVTLGLYGARLAAEWGIPAVQSWPTFVSKPSQMLMHPGSLSPALRELRHKRNLEARLPGQSRNGRKSIRLVLLPRAFQIAGDSFDDSFRFVGPCFSQRAFQGSWQPPEPRRRVIVVTVTEGLSNWPEFFHACFDAFADQPCHVVIAANERQTNGMRLDSVPPNIELRPSVPVLRVLPHADLYINSAGMGTVMEALYFGVPILAIPYGFERPITANRVVRLKLGRQLDPGKVTAASLRQQAEAVMADGTVRASVLRMRDLLRASGGPAAAADVIEQQVPAS
jgi:MGT family glycosyltransferase